MLNDEKTSISVSESEANPTTSLISRYNNCDGLLLTVQKDKCSPSYNMHSEGGDLSSEVSKNKHKIDDVLSFC